MVGKDKNIEVESKIIPPTLSNKEEKASSGWFMIDLAGLTELFHSSRPHLVILSEYLPHSTDPDILMELVDPPESNWAYSIVHINSKSE
jgi:hypothetical protein